MYKDLPYSPDSYHICPCCGTEFGNDDAFVTHEYLRREWVDKGAPWFFGRPHRAWNPWLQLLDAGHRELVPNVAVHNLAVSYDIHTVRLTPQTVPELEFAVA